MINSYNKKPVLDGLGVFLLVLLGIRLVFSAILFFDYWNIIYFIFALCYLIALFGVITRDLYGPIVGAIIISVDMLFAFMLSSLTPFIIGALTADLAILGISIREYNVINRHSKLIPNYVYYGTPNFDKNPNNVSESSFKVNTGNLNDDKSKEYGYRPGQ